MTSNHTTLAEVTWNGSEHCRDREMIVTNAIGEIRQGMGMSDGRRADVSVESEKARKVACERRCE